MKNRKMGMRMSNRRRKWWDSGMNNVIKVIDGLWEVFDKEEVPQIVCMTEEMHGKMKIWRKCEIIYWYRNHKLNAI